MHQHVHVEFVGHVGDKYKLSIVQFFSCSVLLSEGFNLFKELPLGSSSFASPKFPIFTKKKETAKKIQELLFNGVLWVLRVSYNIYNFSVDCNTVYQIKLAVIFICFRTLQSKRARDPSFMNFIGTQKSLTGKPALEALLLLPVRGDSKFDSGYF